MHKYALSFGLPLAALAATGLAHAQSGPTVVWIDHTGRGAVEINECGTNVCGRLVWFKVAANKKAAPRPTGDAPPKAATKDADKGKATGQPDNDTGCKQYFPLVGKVISVPCKR